VTAATLKMNTMKIISQKEVDNVLKLSPLERYKYTVKWVADGGVIYTLARQGTIAIANLETSRWFPSGVRKFSLPYLQKAPGAVMKVMKINLEVFEAEVMPLISKEAYLLNIFSVEDKSGFVVGLDEFITDLHEELSNYG
jgi:hypothetical protein